MDFIVAALLLLFAQQFLAPAAVPYDAASQASTAKDEHAPKPGAAEHPLPAEPAMPGATASVDNPRPIESLLEGRNTSADAVALTGRVVDASPTYGSGVRLTVATETADYAPAEGLVSVSLRQTSRR
ncbi:MAG: hypothetical protein ABR587_06005, partial [Candidatus Binatia bacterium]